MDIIKLKIFLFVFQNKFFFRIFLVLIVSLVIFVQIGDDRIDNGFVVVIELVKVIGNDDFEGIMGILVKSVILYLGMVGLVIGFMFFVLREKKQFLELMFM